MAQTWCPFAKRNALFNGGSFIDRVQVGVIHTTESSGFNPSSSSYFGHNNNPHFTITVDDKNPQVWQHTPINIASRALANRSGGVETNREGVIQIEVVAKAGSPNWSRQNGPGVQLMRRLMRWIEANTDIPKSCSVAFRGGGSYGLNAPQRMSATQWRRYKGWCGHQHVPENEHWDPGAISIGNLLEDEDMELTNKNLKDIAEAVWKYNIPSGHKDNPDWWAQNFLRNIERDGDSANAAIDQVMVLVQGVADTNGIEIDEGKLAERLAPKLLTVLTPEALVGAMSDDMAQRVVDLIGQKLR